MCNIWKLFPLVHVVFWVPSKASEFSSWGKGLDYLREKTWSCLTRLTGSTILLLSTALGDQCHTSGQEQPVREGMQEGIPAPSFPRVLTGLGWWEELESLSFELPSCAEEARKGLRSKLSVCICYQSSSLPWLQETQKRVDENTPFHYPGCYLQRNHSPTALYFWANLTI